MKAVVLLSGGIDSATTLYYAKDKGYRTLCLSFDYGQRHKRELDSAKALARRSGSSLRLVKLSLPWKGSSLLDKGMKLPMARGKRRSIPSTYVPGRNIIFLSYATSYAEAAGAKKIFIGANQIDYSGYPDCRFIFLDSFEDAINKGTKTGVEAKGISIEAPLIKKTKQEIIEMAIKLRVPIGYTWSCYKGGRRPCGLCDSCLIRARAFRGIGRKDPLLNG